MKRSATRTLNSVSGSSTTSGSGTNSSDTDRAVNAYHASTASTTNANDAAIAAMLGRLRRPTRWPAPGRNATGVIAISSSARVSRASSSRSGGAVSPAVTRASISSLSRPPSIRQVIRAVSSATMSPSESLRAPVTCSPATRKFRVSRVGWMKKTPSSMPTDSVPFTPDSRISARGSPPIVTGSASTAKCRVKPSSSVFRTHSVASFIGAPSRRAPVSRRVSSFPSYRLRADHADRIELAARQHGEGLPHVSITVARADHRVVAGTKLDLPRQERAEAADAIQRDLGSAVGDELHRDRRLRDEDELVEALDLPSEPRLLSGRGERLARFSEQPLGVAKHIVAEQQARVVDQIRELRVEVRPRPRALEPCVRERERGVGRERILVLRDRLLPQLAALERERACLGQSDLVELRALLGLEQTVARLGGLRAHRECRLEGFA